MYDNRDYFVHDNRFLLFSISPNSSLESAVDLYLEIMEKCRLSCEVVVFVNLTHPETTTARQEKLEREGFLPDSMEWHLLIRSLVRSLLECRSHCRDKMATVNGTYKSNYLSDHFNHLQFTSNVSLLPVHQVVF